MSASPDARFMPNPSSIPLGHGEWMTINTVPTDGGYFGEGRVWIKDGSAYTPYRIPQSEVFTTKEKALEDAKIRGKQMAY